jgi:molybdopterin/thiamine biosynthesis adenylyltransferase
MTRTNLVDTLRHQNEFSLAWLDTLRIDVIGCGATGQRAALELAGLGVQDLHLWDFDLIEPHNIANQLMAFGRLDVGRPKGEVLAERITALTGLVPTVHIAAATGREQLGHVVFLMTDTMASRQEIWQKAIRRKVGRKLMIETRLAPWEYRIYTVNPMLQSHVSGWECASAYTDEDETVAPGACRAQTTIGATASVVAGQAVLQFIRWLKIQSGMAGGDQIEQERIVCARTGDVMRNFFADLAQAA